MRRPNYTPIRRGADTYTVVEQIADNVEQLSGTKGDVLNRAATLRDLIDLGIVSETKIKLLLAKK